MSDDLARAAAVIGAASELAITCHVNPDGDALGSALGLAHAARRRGIRAVVSFGGEFVVPDTLQFLDSDPLVPPADFPDSPECLVVFDVAVPERLAELAATADRADSVVVVDHHLSNSGFGDVAYVDPSAAASAALAVHLIDELGWEIDATVAQCLLTGLVTDTGRFQYAATNGEVMRIAGRLMDAGASVEVIGQNVYESAAFGYLAVSSAVLGRAVLEQELSLVWSTMTRSDLSEAGVEYSQTDGLIDDLRIAREADVALLLKQTDTGWKGSLRSRGGTDVAALAGLFGGGGHHNAAGFETHDPVEQILEVIRSGLDA